MMGYSEDKKNGNSEHLVDPYYPTASVLRKSHCQCGEYSGYRM